MSTPDLFSWKPAYPLSAGFSEPTTSREAAEGIQASGKAESLILEALRRFQAGFEGTADELSHVMREDKNNIRPRCSQLYKQGLIARTGQRRAMDGGRMGHVLRLA